MTETGNTGSADTCVKCEAPLSWDDIGLHKKLVNRGAEKYFCPDCLAEYFSMTTALILETREQFRAKGCGLFTGSVRSD